jgi:hypothetical protein
MSTITLEQHTAIAAKLAGMTLPSGLGNEEAACSIAAINLALTGELTDDIPDCMSKVIGKWIIEVQDSMPDNMRNSDRWKSLLPRAAGTGRAKEKERLAIILDWMWGAVLPTLQPLADKHGFGREWRTMTTERTKAAAEAAREAAEAAEAALAGGGGGGGGGGGDGGGGGVGGAGRRGSALCGGDGGTGGGAVGNLRPLHAAGTVDRSMNQPASAGFTNTGEHNGIGTYSWPARKRQDHTGVTLAQMDQAAVELCRLSITNEELLDKIGVRRGETYSIG